LGGFFGHSSGKFGLLKAFADRGRIDELLPRANIRPDITQIAVSVRDALKAKIHKAVP